MPVSGFVNGAFFEQVDDQSTGTDVIEPFPSTPRQMAQSRGSTLGQQRLGQQDGIWTHSLLVSDVPVVNLGGTNYFQVLLDINETGANPLLSSGSTEGLPPGDRKHQHAPPAYQPDLQS